ncbi:dihydroorotate dehydrogenase electron transfer subunit [Candidatus Micrarchaeota archaeon]|nr:dihydroorotate dehydrogenase electron transfer subunit [Candidatus Micrarchaeota archaeon]
MVGNPMITARIANVIRENDNITTYELDCTLDAAPGQFIMLWLPGVGERPMGIADSSPLTITVAHLGEFTNAMRKLKKGDRISFRGPLGNGFTLPKKDEKVLISGGGTGMAPLYFLAKTAKKEGAEVIVVFGARSKSLLFYQERLKKAANKLIITTDDGSAGTKGTVMAGIEAAGKPDRVYACGPEKMMAAVVKWAAAKKIPCEASLERYMKCGLGVCGSCMLGGYRVCADGPVFSGEILLKEPEFGSAKRDASGRKVSL